MSAYIVSTKCVGSRGIIRAMECLHMRPHDHTLHSTVNHKVHSDAIETNNVYREREREKESDEKCLDVEHGPIGPNGKIALA